jgi:imidazolonepropionase-like amidohydrolase
MGGIPDNVTAIPRAPTQERPGAQKGAIGVSTKQGARTLIRAARTWDGSGADMARGVAVELVDGRVGRIGADVPAADGTRVLDFPDATLLPGLIDCHVHLTLSGSGNWLGEMQDSVPTLTLRAATFARRTLLGGITTVRTLGGGHGIEIDVKRAIESGLIDGPRIVSAGRIICITGGHGSWVGREADGPDDVRRAVREQLKAGAEVIKFTATGGVMTPGIGAFASSFTLEELTAGVDEAHKFSRRATAHAIGAGGIRNAVLAGCDSVEHGVEIDEELALLMREHGTVLVPTVAARVHFINQGPGVAPDWAIDKIRQAAPLAERSHRVAAETGVTFAMGTDAGTPFNQHGANAQEVPLMVGRGLTARDALLAATRNAAKLLDLEREIGSLEEGKRADAIVVRGDPLADPQLLADPANILAVFKDGVAYKLPAHPEAHTGT